MSTQDLVVIALAVFAFALVSRRAEEGVFTAPMVFVLFGLAVSAPALDLVHLPFRTSFMNDLAEITLVVALFTDAARIDVRRLNVQHDLPLRLLGIGLPLAIVLGLLAAILLFPGMSLWEAALLAVILAPTDAALGQAVVTNERVPVRIRQALNVESGLNDGLAFPALLIFMSLASVADDARGWGEWFLFIAKQVGLGPVAGLTVGYAGAWLVERAVHRRWMSRVFLQISVLSLALLAWGGAELIDGNGFIAAFVAGLVVGTRSKALLDSIEDFGETEGQLLALVVFLLFGTAMAPRLLGEIAWQDVAYAVLSLTAVRMVATAASLIGTRLLPSTVMFLGWFGPRGLASIIYLLLVTESEKIPAASDIFITVCTTVLLSVLLHGLSAAPAARAYAAHMRRLTEEGAGPEHRPVFPFPTRFPHLRGKHQPEQ